MEGYSTAARVCISARGCAGAVLSTPRFRGFDEMSRGSEESPSPKTSYKHRTSTTFCAPPLSTALLLGCERSNRHLLGEQGLEDQEGCALQA